MRDGLVKNAVKNLVAKLSSLLALFQDQASLANAFGAFFFVAPNIRAVHILTDIFKRWQFCVDYVISLPA